ncbi:MAG TPA: hypothetical protein VGY99_19105 [Candidatus Binataceae bacterium]|jgi:hypothetical protein|nr:hypothetical protein [Candidatus Binataceae bacterium]
MSDTIDPVTGKVVLNLISRTHVSRLVLQSLLTVLIKANQQLAEMVVQDLERRRDATREPELRDYMELAIGEVLDASVAAHAK